MFRTPEWREVRLDIDPACQPDVVASITHMPMVSSGSMDAVWSSHNLEHLEAHDVPKALAEFHRVLKIGGFLVITLPDLQKVAEMIAADQLEDVAYVSPAGPISPIDMVYGLRPALAAGNQFMAHRTGFTAKTLARHLQNARFGRVVIERVEFGLWARGEKLEPFSRFS
jgi:SAM-dependent methyltransferase